MFRSLHFYEKNSLQVIVIIAIILVVNTILLYLHNIKEVNQKCRLCTIESATRNSSSSSPYYSQEFKVRRLPQVIIIGTRKSGTRALLKFLEINPSIRAASKEVHFFDRIENYKLGLDWYRNQMPESSNEEITIEKSPAYFVTKGVPERIQTMNSSIKLILILRDPVIRLISDFSQLIANEIENDEINNEEVYDLQYQTKVDSKESIEKVWKRAKEKFKDYVKRSDGGIDERRRAIRTSMYSVHLERWRSIFSKNQLHLVDGENLITNPYSELARLEMFLGLKSVIRPENFVFNPKKGFYCSSTKSHDLEVKNSSLELRNSNSTISCLSRNKGRRHVLVDEDLMEELQRFFEPYNEYLYSLTGRNFNWTKVKQ